MIKTCWYTSTVNIPVLYQNACDELFDLMKCYSYSSSALVFHPNAWWIRVYNYMKSYHSQHEHNIL